MYILFEGVDTSGKTTQIELLKKEYPKSIVTKEPGGTPLGLKIRSMILHKGVSNHITELFLFLADRAEHFEKVIKPNSDRLIISDRGFISGIAYALTNHKDLELDFLLTLNKFALSNKLPDLVILFKTNKELIISRIGEKQEDMIEKRGIAYLLQVQSNMEKVLQKLDINYHTIDSSNSIEDIQKQIKALIDD